MADEVVVTPAALNTLDGAKDLLARGAAELTGNRPLIVDVSRSGATGIEGVTHLIWPEAAFPFLSLGSPIRDQLR